ncbi:MAG TPA: SDR family NAD(P)-dependent oxidoreductase [Acidimicrobiales bacterium]|nr:SDR family NAD(P)-dependent oxidoreductase [Acidimicrobiales bacterium]
MSAPTPTTPPSPTFDLTGHVGLVTGGNGGIGLGMARGLAAAGADVAIWGTNEDKNAAATAELEALGAKVAAFRCDVGDEDQVEAAFAATVEALGKVDSCFANAGVGAGAPIHQMTLDMWRHVQRVNSEGAFLTLRAAARHLIERGEGGRLVGISSTSAIHGAARNIAYAHSKGGMVAMIRGLAVELARYGVTANVILPGWIETDMTAGAFGYQKFVDNVMPRIPHRRWGTPADFAGVAVYLASAASAYHTGDTLVVDGAYTIF